MASKKRFVAKPVVKKTFTVIKTTEGASVPTSSASGRMKKIVQTRPKACLYCRNENKVTKLPDGTWKCKKCGYEWK